MASRSLAVPLRLAAPALAGLAMAGQCAAAEAPQLALPVACEIGKSCMLQNYVDHDASGGARDYRCGTRTYDRHSGTDIRLPTLAAQRAGVDVLAAADGRVARTRDGVADRSVRVTGPATVEGIECGNGVVIEHADGWSTQYCHLARGSVRVKPGDTVTAGQPIGRIGLSGKTEYPHLHFTLRQGDQVVDPFAHGAAPDACSGGASLWREDLRQALAYQPTSVLNEGFAAGPVTMEAIEEGVAGARPPGRDAAALVAFVRAIGLKKGDVQQITLKGPGGEVIADNVGKPLESDKAQYMLFTGRRRPAAGWPRGPYRATYLVRRNGGVVLERSFSTTL